MTKKTEEKWTFAQLLEASEHQEQMKRAEQKARKIAQKVRASQPNDWQRARQ